MRAGRRCGRLHRPPGAREDRASRRRPAARSRPGGRVPADPPRALPRRRSRPARAEWCRRRARWPRVPGFPRPCRQRGGRRRGGRGARAAPRASFSPCASHRAYYPRNTLPDKKTSGATAMAAAVPPAADEFILETRGLTKEFSGFTAVNNVDLKVRRGHIHALIGPNGAGKTTFFNLLTKFLIPTRGAIIYRGRDITPEKPAQVARAGMVRSFQLSAVFPHLTALENVRIALQRSLRTTFHFWRHEATLGVLDARARELLELVDLSALAGALAVELPYGRKRALEIATTLAMDPELLLLDEPTQGMAQEDVERVTALIRQAAANRTVLMV